MKLFFFDQDLTLHKKPVVKERRPNTPRIIYVAGGYFRHSIGVFEAFNIDDNAWTTLPQLTVPRSGLGAAFLKVHYYKTHLEGIYSRIVLKASNIDDHAAAAYGLRAAFLKAPLPVQHICLYIIGQ